MAKPYVTGPAHVFVGVGSNYQLLYFGTCEKTPRIRIRPSYSPVFNDIAGQTIPFDWVYDGEEGFVSGRFSRLNESVLGLMQDRIRLSAGVRGVDQPGDIGTLMVSEGAAYPLVVQFPYAAKPAYADMPGGYRFFAAFLEGPDDLEDLGTLARKVGLLWRCSRAYVVAPTGGITLSLYSHDMSGLPAIN